MELECIGPFLVGRTLGIGSTGKVKLGVHRETGQRVAIKIIRKDVLTVKPSLRRKVEREISVLRLIDHPNVLKLIDVVETTDHLYIIMEYVVGGELFDFLVKRGRLVPTEAFRLFRQVLSGVEHCHGLLICHRDLKPENLLLDANACIKIADFGMASLMRDGSLLETSCGSPHYASPEIVMGLPYDGMCADVWSLGVILFALLTGKLPFDDDNVQKLLNKVKRGLCVIPNYVEADSRDLLLKMLQVDPVKRITLEGIRRHPWIVRYQAQLPPQKELEHIHQVEVAEPISDPGKVDPVILHSLQTLGWGTEEELRGSLMSAEPNLERVFYRLLEHHTAQDQSKQASESVNLPDLTAKLTALRRAHLAEASIACGSRGAATNGRSLFGHRFSLPLSWFRRHTSRNKDGARTPPATSDYERRSEDNSLFVGIFRGSASCPSSARSDPDPPGAMQIKCFKPLEEVRRIIQRVLTETGAIWRKGLGAGVLKAKLRRKSTTVAKFVVETGESSTGMVDVKVKVLSGDSSLVQHVYDALYRDLAN
eukprot:TRINITY_DN18889_c0_g1_i1.p1 TRINITY_DN18889_c0_g1~~TRINITY_DN18889_c0_g1_i1.p1  ORF type:complete len:576 (+),score=102.61 TRINITY_DN18889_c0_g1_i1:115-1728(+)